MKTCISAEVIDLHHQAPNPNERASKYYWNELYTYIDAAGFLYIEMPYESKWDFGGRSGIPLTNRSIMTKFDSVENCLETLKQCGIDGITSIHLDTTMFCSGNMQIFFGAVTHFAEEAIAYAKDAAAVVVLSATPSYYALKGICPQDTNFEDFEEEFLKMELQVVDHLAEIAEESGVKLCLKNEYWSLLRGKKIMSFIADLKNKVYLDVDTAQLQIAGIDLAEFVHQNSNHIGIVHFTDTSFVDDQEAYLQVLFPDLLKALQEIYYDGTIVYNCRHSYDICRSLLRTIN